MESSSLIYGGRMAATYRSLLRRNAMNEIQRLNEHIRKAFPDAKIDLVAPLHHDGIWSLDIDFRDKHLAVEWTQGRGFGLSSAQLETYGERPDEFYSSLEEVNRRLDQLMSGVE